MRGRAARYLLGTGTVLLALLRTPASTPSKERMASTERTWRGLLECWTGVVVLPHLFVHVV